MHYQKLDNIHQLNKTIIPFLFRWTDINVKELTDALAYPGFIKMALKYVTAGAYEISKSVFPTLQVKELQKFIPSITKDDILPGPAGVRAQALDIHGKNNLYLKNRSKFLQF